MTSIQVLKQPCLKKSAHAGSAFAGKLDGLELDILFDEKIDFCRLLNSLWSRHMFDAGVQAVPSPSGHDPLMQNPIP